MPAVEIKGVPELHQALSGLKAELRDMTPTNAKVAGDLAKAIGSAAPRVSGALAASWSGAGTRDKAEASSDLDYAPVIEYGSSSHNIAGQHYAERTLAARSGAIEKQYESDVARLCKKAEK